MDADNHAIALMPLTQPQNEACVVVVLGKLICLEFKMNTGPNQN